MGEIFFVIRVIPLLKPIAIGLFPSASSVVLLTDGMFVALVEVIRIGL